MQRHGGADRCSSGAPALAPSETPDSATGVSATPRPNAREQRRPALLARSRAAPNDLCPRPRGPQLGRLGGRGSASYASTESILLRDTSGGPPPASDRAIANSGRTGPAGWHSVRPTSVRPCCCSGASDCGACYIWESVRFGLAGRGPGAKWPVD